MDRPEDIACYQCGTPLGHLTFEEIILDCPQCHAVSQPGPGDTSVPATAMAIQLQDELRRLKHTFARQSSPYMIKVWGGRQTGYRLFPPDEGGVLVGPIVSGIALVLGTAGCLFFRHYAVAAGLAALGGWVIYRALREVDVKRSGYHQIKATYEASVHAVRARIDAEISRG